MKTRKSVLMGWPLFIQHLKKNCNDFEDVELPFVVKDETFVAIFTSEEEETTVYKYDDIDELADDILCPEEDCVFDSAWYDGERVDVSRSVNLIYDGQLRTITRNW